MHSMYMWLGGAYDVGVEVRVLMSCMERDFFRLQDTHIHVGKTIKGITTIKQ